MQERMHCVCLTQVYDVLVLVVKSTEKFFEMLFRCRSASAFWLEYVTMVLHQQSVFRFVT